jgi:hydroxyacylglutathione hydrolase
VIFEPYYELGNTWARVLHTPESVCLVVTDLRRGADPWFVLTGDTLFVGAVGRPDRPGPGREHAGQLFDSIRGKLPMLPDEVEAVPAHLAGSACGAGMSGKPSSTIGFERRWNQLLASSREAFVEAVAEVPAQSAMDEMLRINRGWPRAVS